MKKLMVLAIVAMMVLNLAPGAYALGELNPDMTKVFTRGFKNALTFWVEVPKTLYHEGKAEPGKGHLRGVFLGPMKAFERALSGVWDMATSPCSQADRLAVDPETLI